MCERVIVQCVCCGIGNILSAQLFYQAGMQTKMSADKMIVVKMTVNKMTADKMTA